MSMTVSRNGALFIAAREALVLVAYPDPDDQHLSVGFGHNGTPEQIASVITVAQGFDLLKQDLSTRAADLNRWLKVAVTQPQFDALASLYYEYGMQDKGIEDVIYSINAGDTVTAMGRFLACARNALPKVALGLIVRRCEEVNLFLTANYGSIGTVELFTGLPATTKSAIYTVQDGNI